MNLDNNLRQLLENETKIHLAEIRFLYQKLDRQLGLNGARTVSYTHLDVYKRQGL